MSVIRLTSFWQRIQSSLFQSVFPPASYQSVLKIHTKDGQSNINTSEKLSQETLDLLVCPLTKKKLRYDEERQLLINDELNIGYKVNDGIPNLEVVYTYCPHCNLCWQDKAASKTSLSLPLYLGNIKVILDFLSSEEEATAIKEIDQIPWMPSQSGRKKQDFGPKVNFKKKKSKVGNFKGFPNFSKRFIDRFQQLKELSDFSPVELCHLDYSPDRGSAIEPHIDDFWIWGERLVTINLASQTILSLTPANAHNCDCLSFCTSEFPSSFTEECYHQTSGILSKTTDLGRLSSSCNQNFDLESVQCICAVYRTIESNVTPRVLVLLPPRSLIVLAGCARYNWFHAIKRDDIASRRLAMTFRELSSDFLVNENEKELGKELIDIGKRFCDFNVHS